MSTVKTRSDREPEKLICIEISVVLFNDDLIRSSVNCSAIFAVLATNDQIWSSSISLQSLPRAMTAMADFQDRAATQWFADQQEIEAILFNLIFFCRSTLFDGVHSCRFRMLTVRPSPGRTSFAVLK
jgi:hypothetical protein